MITQEQEKPTQRFKDISLRQLTKADKQKILNLYNIKDNRGYRTYQDLFNWCMAYNDFIRDGVLCCLSMEYDYILKKSYEDKDTPFSYEDLDLFDLDKARETLTYIYEDKEQELKEYANNPDTFNRKVKTKGDFEVFLNSLSQEELKEMCKTFEIDQSDTDAEVYEWWGVADPLKYRLEKQGEIFLNEVWGRCTTGQSIALDSCCIKAFISMLEDNIY
jgi:hypothetical protein